MVYIFEKESYGNWLNKTKITPNDKPQENVHFGHSITIGKEMLVAGSPNSLNNGKGSGSVYTSRMVIDNRGFGKEWKKELPAAVNGNVIAVGSPGDRENGRRTGAAYVFENKNDWEDTVKHLCFGKTARSRIGHIGSIGINGDVASNYKKTL